MYWGYHLILDCAGCELGAITTEDHIRVFSLTLVDRINMDAVGPPHIELLLEGDANEGYSLMQMISTSNITAHFVTNTCEAYIDVFSCKNFDQKTVRETVEQFFKPSSIKTTFLHRQA